MIGRPPTPLAPRLLCVGLCVALLCPEKALAAPATDGAPVSTTAAGGGSRTGADDGDPQSPARASLAVDTSATGPQSLVLLRRIEELGDIELRRAEVLPSHSERDPLLKISLRQLDGGGYAIVSSLIIAGEPLANSEREVLCNLCTEGETVERARVEVDRLIPFVREHAADEARTSSEQAPQDTSEADPNTSDIPKGARFGVKGKAGFALIGLGLASVGVGAVLSAREPTVKPEMPLETLDTRTPGFVTLGLGGAALVTGAVLLLLDRRSSKTRPIAVTPSRNGLTIVGRF